MLVYFLFTLLLPCSWGAGRETPALQLHDQLLPRPRGGLQRQSQRDDIRHPLSAVGRPAASWASLLPKHIRVQVSSKHSGGGGGRSLKFTEVKRWSFITPGVIMSVWMSWWWWKSQEVCCFSVTSIGQNERGSADALQYVTGHLMRHWTLLLLLPRSEMPAHF